VPRLLLIEDDGALRQVLTEYFADEGYDVLAAASDDDVPTDLNEGDLQAIVTDASANSESSQVDRTRLRRLTALAPTVLYTARAWAAEARPRDLGVAAIVLKPADLESLGAVVGAISGTQPRPSTA
jgi:DNA-binding response OmpR family regulator